MQEIATLHIVPFIIPCAMRGIEPLTTIYHDEMLAHLSLTNDGWANRSTLDAYVRYCKALFERFGKKCKWHLTFNEINAIRGFASCGTREHNVPRRVQGEGCMGVYGAAARDVLLYRRDGAGSVSLVCAGVASAPKGGAKD